MTEQGTTYTPRERAAMTDRYIEQSRAKLADQLVRGADHLIISDLDHRHTISTREEREMDDTYSDGAGI